MESATSGTAGDGAFDRWVAHFAGNRARHAAIEARIEWSAVADLPDHVRTAIARSFQRFALGEGGDGARLLAKARRCSDAQQQALRMLVEEEQRHSELFTRGLRHLDAVPLGHHWSDRVFTALRRSMGLRTELALFLVAEAVAMPYFVVLARSGPDEVTRAIGTRIALDEEHHLAFQIDQLRQEYRSATRIQRRIAFLAWWCIAVGAATVVSVDHGAALRVCGLSVRVYWGAALRSFRRTAAAALT